MALRQQVWVDRNVQGVLVGRVLLYWTCGLLYVGIGSACFQYNQHPDWTLARHLQVLFGQMWPWLPTAIMVLPLAIYDVVRLSNLFVGPVYRLRGHFAKMREDIACAPLNFREDDCWRDLAAPINEMQAEILKLRSNANELQQAAAISSALIADFNARSTDDIDANSENELAAFRTPAGEGPRPNEKSLATLESDIAIAPISNASSIALRDSSSTPTS